MNISMHEWDWKTSCILMQIIWNLGQDACNYIIWVSVSLMRLNLPKWWSCSISLVTLTHLCKVLRKIHGCCFDLCYSWRCVILFCMGILSWFEHPRRILSRTFMVNERVVVDLEGFGSKHTHTHFRKILQTQVILAKHSSRLCNLLY